MKLVRVGNQGFDLDTLCGWSAQPPADRPGKPGKDRPGLVTLYFTGGTSRDLALPESQLTPLLAWLVSNSEDVAAATPAPAPAPAT